MRGALYTTFFSIHRPGRLTRAIFLYHSVGGASPLAESVPAFRAQMCYVARWFRVLRLSDFLAAAADDPPRSLATITFDDGFADNATAARAILDELNLPATFFVVTGRLGRDLQTSAGPFALMTPAQVRSLAAAGHEIGSHSVTHPTLPDLPAAAAQQEILDSKRYLEDLLGSAVTSFAYPKGRVNEEVRRLVKEAGYDQAVVTRRAFVTAPIDPLALPRVAVKDYIRLATRRSSV